MKKYFKGLGFYVVLTAIILLVFAMTRVTPEQENGIYSDLVRSIQNHEVSEISIVSDIATVKYKNSDSEQQVEVPGYAVLRADVGDEMEAQIKDGSLKIETPIPAEPRCPRWAYSYCSACSGSCSCSSREAAAAE